MRRLPILFVSVAIVLTGCNSKATQDGATTSVPATDLTRQMLGRWGTDGEEVVSLTLDADRVIIAAPSNETWRMDVQDAEIVGDTIRFVQINYLQSGDFHPFSGVACNATISLVDDDRLRFELQGASLPEIEPEILVRMK